MTDDRQINAIEPIRCDQFYDGLDCFDRYSCCDCGTRKDDVQSCLYCFSCNACDVCYQKREE